MYNNNKKMSQTEIDIYIEAYIAQLTAIELRVLNIAKTHLESSFNLAKSVGFIQWRKEQPDLMKQCLKIKPFIGKL